jgi:FkbH-like protein
MSVEAVFQTQPAFQQLKNLLKARDAAFWELLQEQTEGAATFGEVMALNTMRKRATSMGMDAPYTKTVRIAIAGGPSLRPLGDLLEHFMSVLNRVNLEVWTGDYDNYVSEISSEDSDLFAFSPSIVFLLPSEARCTFTGAPSDPVSVQREQAESVVQDLIGLCDRIHRRCGAQVILANFRLPPWFDPGPTRNTSLASDYSFRKYVNMQLGLNLPDYVCVCDVEFLANRLGTVASTDRRTWFESKQPYSTELMVAVAREFALIASMLTSAPKKVLVLDLDNTLWGGVVGDDGVEGIEIGTTSPIGEAYRDFQSHILALSKRGVLLAVCSKNDYAKAIEPFERHPEMLLRLSDIVSFKANWEAKSDSIREIAQELNLGLDSFVFLDDNLAEIEIVRQFLPDVSAVWLGDDPSAYSRILLDGRYFESRSITIEDTERVNLYKQEARRKELEQGATNMDSYLTSLGMVAHISEFTALDTPRIAQLINKSNQFNLTTKRRSEADVRALLIQPNYITFSVRLADKFGDHGLIAVVIGQIEGDLLSIDTWLMSCRVLKRQVEEVTLNEVMRLASSRQCKKVVGAYIPTAKNQMVKDLYPSLGFFADQTSGQGSRFTIEVSDYTVRPTHISIRQRAYAAE